MAAARPRCSPPPETANAAAAAASPYEAAMVWFPYAAPTGFMNRRASNRPAWSGYSLPPSVRSPPGPNTE